MVLALHSQTPFPCMCDLFLQVPLSRPCTRGLTGQALVAHAHVDLEHTRIYIHSCGARPESRLPFYFHSMSSSTGVVGVVDPPPLSKSSARRLRRSSWRGAHPDKKCLCRDGTTHSAARKKRKQRTQEKLLRADMDEELIKKANKAAKGPECLHC